MAKPTREEWAAGVYRDLSLLGHHPWPPEELVRTMRTCKPTCPRCYPDSAEFRDAVDRHAPRGGHE
jgi:hypothetical protein